jgi:hypothetical protein
MNKHGLNLKWPRLWIIILGIILIILCFCIAGMEVGHTISDLYRSTAFGGFIVFLPFIICAILILITGESSRAFLMNINKRKNVFSFQTTFTSSSYYCNPMFYYDYPMFCINRL